MKTNSFLTSVFVTQKIRKRAQRVNGFLKTGGHESKAEVASATDFLLRQPIFFMQNVFSRG
jgi:hypothetical protein